MEVVGGISICDSGASTVTLNGWLSAITSKPECITLRSAFADWLQDRSDSRWEKVAASCVDDGIDRTTDILLEFPLQTSSLSSAYKRRSWTFKDIQIDGFLRPLVRVGVPDGRWQFHNFALSTDADGLVDLWVLTKSDRFYCSVMHRQEIMQKGVYRKIWNWNTHIGSNFTVCLKADRPMIVSVMLSAEAMV